LPQRKGFCPPVVAIVHVGTHSSRKLSSESFYNLGEVVDRSGDGAGGEVETGFGECPSKGL